MFLLADVVFFVWAPMAALFVIAYRRIVYGVALWRLYGPPGLLLLVFGRQMTWRAEAQVLARVDEEGNAQSLKFQQALKDECSMIAISVRNPSPDKPAQLMSSLGRYSRADRHHRPDTQQSGSSPLDCESAAALYSRGFVDSCLLRHVTTQGNGPALDTL